MKVRELIAILQTVDPELPVVREDNSYPFSEVRTATVEPDCGWLYIRGFNDRVDYQGPALVLES